MSDIYKIVSSYEKVRNHLLENPKDDVKIKKILDEIKGDYKFGVLSKFSSFLDKTFAKLYDDLKLDIPEEFDLDDALKKYHLVLVPNHQSHADYIALQYIFFNRFKIPIYIAAGINLNIFPIGPLFKKCGAFFIRRKFDDHLYKITFQAYIYYLLKTGKIVEFFFEGGRTRTGKLLPPKYGLFSMILDAHSKFDSQKPLMFIPLSLAHEQIPEERAHAKELSGGAKVKEKPTQLLKLYKLFSKKLGTIHVKMGKGIIVEGIDDLKKDTQTLAFKCFREVGRGMPITPSSLLSLIFLDEPSGALTWNQVESRATEISKYCLFMDIPLTDSLLGDELLPSLRVAMDMFIADKKVLLSKREKLNKIFYTLEEKTRVNLLFHKNMVLHHFFAPAIVNATWAKILKGEISKPAQLIKFLLEKRKELKYEFYIPSTDELIEEGKRVIEYALGKTIQNLEDVLDFSQEDLDTVARKVRFFSTALSSINESYYLAAISVKYLESEKSAGTWTSDYFFSICEELFSLEREHGRIIRYAESYTIPKMKSALNFLDNKGIIDLNEERIKLKDLDKLNNFIEKCTRDINDHVGINLKFRQDN